MSDIPKRIWIGPVTIEMLGLADNKPAKNAKEYVLADELDRLAAKVEQQRAESLPLSVARDVVIANCANCGGHGWVMVTGAVMGPDGGPEPVPMQEQCQYCGIVCDALNEAAQAAARGD